MRAAYLFDATDRRTRLPSTASFSGFDAAQIRVKYDSRSLFGAAQYSIFGGTYPYDRPNGYDNYFGEMSFLKFAYAGYKISPTDSVIVGLQQIPFGIVPYFGVSFLETMGYVVGMEDAFNVGIKYSHVELDLNYQLAYFPSDGGHYFGISTDSARYTTNIVSADPSLRDGTNNVEQHALAGRVERTFFRSDTSSVTLGASVLKSSIYNYDTGLYGSRQQAALHLIGTHKAWTTRAVAARLDINPRNPGGRNALITMGSYDAPFNVATKGFLVSAEVSHKFMPEDGPFSEITPYFHYSSYIKDREEFNNSDRFMVGSIFKSRDLDGLVVYSEFRIGRNDIYVGSGNYAQGAGAGGTNEWAASWFTNIGYYF